MMISMIIKNLYWVIEYNLSRKILNQLLSPIRISRFSDAVVESFVMSAYGPQISQTLTPFKNFSKTVEVLCNFTKHEFLSPTCWRKFHRSILLISSNWTELGNSIRRIVIFKLRMSVHIILFAITTLVNHLRNGYQFLR